MPDPSLSPRSPRSGHRDAGGDAQPRIARSRTAADAARSLAAPILADTASADRSVASTRNPGFEDAYREHSTAVFGLARRLLGDRSLAEEVTQEVFLRLWNRPHRFDATRGCLRTFLLTECHGRSIDTIRSEFARQRREERDGRSSERQSVTDVADDVCDAAVHDEVALLLEALPEVEREAISLAYTTQATYQAVASMLDMPEGTVKGRIRSGLRRMRSQMGEDPLEA